MVMTSQRVKGATAVVLAAIIIAYGAGILSGAGRETASEDVAARGEDSRKATAEPSGRIAGVVRDDKGRPVAGATVVAGQFDGGKPNHRIATTHSDGRFDFAPGGGSASLDYVVAHKEGFVSASFFRARRDDRADSTSAARSRLDTTSD